MASIVLSSLGSSLGNAILPGLGGRLLGTLGRSFGASLDQQWGWSASNRLKDGPRLESFKVQDSRYGVGIARLFGQIRVAGNILWVSDIVETSHETQVSGTSSGGKGGGSVSVSTTRTTYTYSLHCAVALGEGEIGGIQTIWADSKIIYQNGVWTSGVVESATFYAGTQDQEVDPLLESWIGAGLSPAYKGMAYVVLESLQLSNFGNRLPNLTFEVIPKTPTGAPSWLGGSAEDFYLPIAVNRNGGMPALRIEGGQLSARRMLVGGYKISGSATKFTVAEIDVTGEAPVELFKSESASFAGSDPADVSWALAPDGRFVALGLQDSGVGKPYTVMIYDSKARSFGASYSFSMPVVEMRKIAWIDAQRFVVMDYLNDRRGVRVLMRAGMDVADLGITDVWGAASRTAYVPEMDAQFIAYADGLLNLVVDRQPNFSQITARMLRWKNGALSVGGSFSLIGSVDAGTGNGGQTYLFPSGDGEWTLFYGTTFDMRLVSFRPSDSGAAITRPWQALKNLSFGTALCHAPVLIGNRIVVLQRANYENFYRVSEIALGEGSFSLASDGAVLEGLDQVGLNFSAVALDSTRLLASVNGGTLGLLSRLDLVRRRNTGDTLDNVVAKILEKAGYTASDYDVTALAGLPVDGYALTGPMTGADALAPLQDLEAFDLIESDGRLRAVLRGQGEAIEIEEAELGAQDFDKEEKKSIPLVTRINASAGDAPAEIAVDYMDVTRDYEVGSQKARRSISGGSTEVVKIDLPLVCSPSKAKRIAQTQLYTMWSERTAYRLFLSRAWMALEPDDILSVQGARMRVLAARFEGGTVRIDAVSCAPADLASAAYAESAAQSAQTQSDLPATTLFLMDVPLLNESDDQPGLYIAATGLEGWGGASLWRAADGVNFAQIATMSFPAVAGGAVTLLPSGSTLYRDRASSVRVQLLRGSLASCSEDDLMNGANAARLGGEILQFRSAVLIGPGLYELSDFLRGRRGTESAVSTHAVGEAFVLLTSGSVQFLPVPSSDRNRTYNFRAVTSGGSLALAQDLALAYGFKTLEPFAPVHLRAVRQVGGDILFTWVRRARKNAAWVDYIDVPLDEANEAYDVEIADASSGAVQRMAADVAATSLTYTLAQQTADWGGAAPSSLRLNVYQKSARFGRGAQASAIV